MTTEIPPLPPEWQGLYQSQKKEAKVSYAALVAARELLTSDDEAGYEKALHIIVQAIEEVIYDTGV